MEKSFGPHHGGKERQESAQAKAERLLAEELARSGLSAEGLAARRKADRQKVRIARRLRRESTMTWSWIAQRLAMGAPAYAANCARETKGQHED